MEVMVAGLVSNLALMKLFYNAIILIKKVCPTFYPTLFGGPFSAPILLPPKNSASFKTF